MISARIAICGARCHSNATGATSSASYCGATRTAPFWTRAAKLAALRAIMVLV